MGIAPQSGLDNTKKANRIIMLAEILFNLQSIVGMRSRIERIRTDDIEASVAELEAAEFLFKCKVPFSFVEEKGLKGFDYDIDVQYKGEAIACEVKCKVTDREFSSNTIINTLKGASSQLPKDRPGIVFVRIPERWTYDESANQQYRESLDIVFRHTKTISLIITRSERWHLPIEAPGAAYGMYYYASKNPRARHPVNDFEKMMGQFSSDAWRDIPSLTGLPRLQERSVQTTCPQLIKQCGNWFKLSTTSFGI